MHNWESLLFLELTDFFFKKGYDLIFPLRQFRKSRERGFENIILSCVEEPGLLVTDLSLGVRLHQVEHWVQSYLGMVIDFRTDSNTVLLSVSKLLEQPYLRYKAHSEAEVKQLAQTIRQLMLDKGFDLLEKFSDPKYLHSLLNQAPGLPCLYFHNQVHYCFKGVALAYLVHHPDMEGLVATYRKMLSQLSPPQTTLQKFELFISQLKSLALH
jgi:hypothetical protein